MEGKILGAGVICGKDGKRYAFELNEVQNTQGKDIDEFIDSEVDFEIVNEKAVSIYITEFKSISPNSNANLGANSNANSSPLNSQTPSVLHAAQNFTQKTFVKAEPLSPQMQELKQSLWRYGFKCPLSKRWSGGKIRIPMDQFFFLLWLSLHLCFWCFIIIAILKNLPLLPNNLCFCMPFGVG